MVIRTSDRRWLLCSIISRRRTCTTRSTSRSPRRRAITRTPPERDHRREVTNESTILGGRLSGAEAGASSRKERECTATDSRRDAPSCMGDVRVTASRLVLRRRFRGFLHTNYASVLHWHSQSPSSGNIHHTCTQARITFPRLAAPPCGVPNLPAMILRSDPLAFLMSLAKRGRLARPALQGTAPGTWAIRLRHEEPIRPVATSARAGERPGGFLGIDSMRHCLVLGRHRM